MSAPYPIGSRVVCPNPAGRLFVGVVHHVHNCGDLTVTDGVAHVRASVEEVRPVMPRDRGDLERWGRWWWRDGEPVRIEQWQGHLWGVIPSDKWSGPVQPPPEVRS